MSAALSEQAGVWPDIYMETADMVLRGNAGIVHLPYDVPSTTGVRLLPGVVSIEAGAALLAAAEIFERCVPWCIAYVVPHMQIEGTPMGGVSIRGSRCIAVAVSDGLLAAIRTAHHEVWHASECEMTAECVAAVDAVVAVGRAWPSEYLSRPSERRARLYSAWATAADEGWGPAGVDGSPLTRVDAVFHDVYTGRFADQVSRADELARSPPAGGLLRRLLG